MVGVGGAADGETSGAQWGYSYVQRFDEDAAL